MKFVKSISLILICVFVLSVASLTSAADDFDAKIEIEYKVSDSGNIIVTASLNDIKAKNGVIVLEYDILYDKTALSLVNANANIPDKWKDDYDQSNDESTVQDLSMLRNDGFYIWSVLTTAPDVGVVDDDQLFIVLEFEKLNSSSTKIEVTNGSVITEHKTVVGGKPTYKMYQLSTNNAVINIDLNTPDSPDIDTDISNPSDTFLPVPPNENTSNGEGSTNDEPINPINPLKPPSGNNGPGENEDPHHQGDDNGPKNDFENPDDEHPAKSNSSLFWILGIIAAVVSVFVVVYVIVVIKSKGSKND